MIVFSSGIHYVFSCSACFSLSICRFEERGTGDGRRQFLTDEAGWSRGWTIIFTTQWLDDPTVGASVWLYSSTGWKPKLNFWAACTSFYASKWDDGDGIWLGSRPGWLVKVFSLDFFPVSFSFRIFPLPPFRIYNMGLDDLSITVYQFWPWNTRG